MKIITAMLCCISFYTSAMQYALAPFKCAYNATYNTTSFILGDKTYLEIDMGLFLETVAVEEYTDKKQLKNFVSIKTEEYINNKAKSSPAFLAYLGSLWLRDSSLLADKIEKQIDSFVEMKINGLKTSEQVIDDFIIIDQGKS